jgi:hypothetical protein
MKLEQAHIDQIRKQFAEMKSKEDLVKLLSDAKNMLYGEECKPVQLKSLTYYANPTLCKKRYQTFKIKKKSGQDRIIHAPVKGLKSILRSLNFVLQCVYEPHKAATGFVLEKSIVDNAKKHVGHRYVLNMDLKDFFHTFDRNRVKMGFIYEPFNLNGEREPLAFLLASLCTHPLEIDGEVKTVLPQGSPTSPTLTNILCRKLDRRLTGLAKRFGAVYTRYADDITFSSYHNIYKNEEFQKELKRIIEEDQKLVINPNKTRLQKAGHRQESTGLIVNDKVNVRRRYVKQIRMWLYYWEKYGYEKAEQIFKRDYIADKGHVKKMNAHLKNVLNGKLEFLKMVKGAEDGTYKKLKERFDKLSSKEVEQVESQLSNSEKNKSIQENKENSNNSKKKKNAQLIEVMDETRKSQKESFYKLSPKEAEVVKQKQGESKILNKYSRLSDEIKELFDKNGLLGATFFHNPGELNKLLSNFTRDPILKWTTHSWDVLIINPFREGENSSFTINDYFKAIEDRFKEYIKIKNYCSDLWWKAIYPFIFQNKVSKNNDGKEIPYQWGEYGIKIGWQYPDVLKKWAEKNYDSQPNASRKTPFEMEVTKDFLSDAALKRYKELFGKEIKYFGDIVELFKREIQFREESKDLYYEILEIKKQELIEFNVSGLEKLKDFSFYTYVPNVLKAIRRIFRMIQKRTEFPDIEIICSQSGNLIELRIVHIDSFPSKKSSDDKFQNPSGDLIELIKKLISLCDFEIESKFSDGNFRISYLYDNVEIKKVEEGKLILSPQKHILNTVPKGFTFILKFPI